MDEARARGHREAVLSAQVHAAPFYRSHGFVEEGAEYLEAGIAHRDMRRRL
jgi:predicted GNAT family N-acyltransferase